MRKVCSLCSFSTVLFSKACLLNFLVSKSCKKQCCVPRRPDNGLLAKTNKTRFAQTTFVFCAKLHRSGNPAASLMHVPLTPDKAIECCKFIPSLRRFRQVGYPNCGIYAIFRNAPESSLLLKVPLVLLTGNPHSDK